MRILHLEDDGPLREILAAALKAVSPTCELVQFIHSDKAVAYIEENTTTIDLFILDIRVPGALNGLQVAQKIRELNCPGAIVITSAYTVPGREFLESVQAKWFAKPWHIMEMTQEMLEVAKKKRLAAEAPLAKPTVPTSPKPAVPKPATSPAVATRAATPPRRPARSVQRPSTPKTTPPPAKPPASTSKPKPPDQ